MARHGPDSLKIRINVVQPVKRFDLAEQECLVQCPLARKNEVRFNLVLCPLQLMRRHVIRNDSFQFIIDTGFDAFNRVSTPGFGTDVKQRRILCLTILSGYKRHRLLLFDHPLVQPRRFTLSQNHGENLERITGSVGNLRRVVRDGEPRYL